MATRKSPSKMPSGDRTTAKTAAKVAKPLKSSKAATGSPAAAARKRIAKTPMPAAVSAEQRYRAIAHTAYLRAEERGFAPGHEVEDWLAAEAEFDAAHQAQAE